MLTLADGCAAIGVGSSGSGPVPAALPPAGELSGTWHGSFWQLGGSLYANEGQSILEIKEDGTFTATVMPGPGANNLAKPSAWSGTVVSSGTRVTLRHQRDRG